MGVGLKTGNAYSSESMRRGIGIFGCVQTRIVACVLFGLAVMVIAIPDVDATGDNRTISLYNIHSKESLTVAYKVKGRYVPSALNKINWLMRDWRLNKVASIDPKLIDLMWDLHKGLGSQKPIHLISGFRSKITNEALRRTRGGQARNSRHIHGKAADIHFPDVPLKKLRNSALVRERGGVGYYPTSAIPFVHVDTSRVRHWPRLGRKELAMLFSKRRTRHIPADGKPLTASDRKKARVMLAKLQNRTNNKTLLAKADVSEEIPPAPQKKPTVLASLTPTRFNVPGLKAAKKHWNRLWVNVRPERYQALDSQNGEEAPETATSPVLTASMMGGAPKGSQQATEITSQKVPTDKLQVASLTTSMPMGSTDGDGGMDTMESLRATTPLPATHITKERLVHAPAFDEDHPEELLYRHYPVRPLLAETPTSRNIETAAFTAPIRDKVHELFGDMASVTPMQFRPTAEQVRLIWAKEFRTAQTIKKTPTRNIQIAQR